MRFRFTFAFAVVNGDPKKYFVDHFFVVVRFRGRPGEQGASRW